MLGDIRVTRVEEDVRPGGEAHEFFAPYCREELEPYLHWLAPKYFSLELNKPISSVHTWVIRTPSQVILLDTCTGNHKDRPGYPRFHMLNTPYLDRLRVAGVTPEEVDIVFCSHLHADHVGWNTQLLDGRWVPTFPNAKYLMSRKDYEYSVQIAHDETAMQSRRNTYFDSVLPVVEAGQAIFVDGHEELDHGLVLRPAPGHTPGQTRLDLTSGSRMACFCGDVLHNPLQVPLWQWSTSACADPVESARSRRAVLEHCVETGAMLMPAHFAHPYSAYIQAAGDSFGILWPNRPGALRGDSTPA
ncbi:MBL fold metallo-hydrolase [Diaphorobacter sp. HDW4A]|uniref:MBL fold metallo-hydrolase n=1 Tax=Diaphorobacter sp. HDW4A TaxID=2714924 RepID=UPI00140A79D7|nr:MBL fold metallo-hydrolase [Diaphorobacter sp. HDW4A]QIL80003.1 MBL fold metallo-hydrolase [Diaphorobacter sp. HDW4A]